MAKNKGGRPSVITKEVLLKLEEGFSYGFTDEQACLYANISTTPFYNYLKKHPEFKERKEILKDQPKIQAKRVVVDKIKEGDEYNSRWYLERKAKDEFSTRTEERQVLEDGTDRLDISDKGGYGEKK